LVGRATEKGGLGDFLVLVVFSKNVEGVALAATLTLLGNASVGGIGLAVRAAFAVSIVNARNGTFTAQLKN
jgi:hypothetical protein